VTIALKLLALHLVRCGEAMKRAATLCARRGPTMPEHYLKTSESSECLFQISVDKALGAFDVFHLGQPTSCIPIGAAYLPAPDLVASEVPVMRE
jgi:hypothetical protein